MQTSDLVKRRYSTRFNNLPADFEAAAPPIPSLPNVDFSKYDQSGDWRPPPSRGGGGSSALQVDARALRDPKFNPDQCMFLSLEMLLIPVNVNRCGQDIE